MRCPGPPSVGKTSTMARIRPAVANDRAFVQHMLVLAADWRPDVRSKTVDEILAEPTLARYVDGWQRPNDVGVIAEDTNGHPIGAAWWRYMPIDDPGFGFVSPTTPEISIAVVPASRRRGVGRLLLSALIGEAKKRGIDQLSLSVEDDNPAQTLYASLGFTTHSNNGGSVTMLADTSVDTS